MIAPAAHFLAGSILSLVLPVGLLVVIAVWYVLGVRRYSAPAADTRPAANTRAAASPSDAPPRDGAA